MEQIINFNTLNEKYPKLKFIKDINKFIGNIHIVCVCKDEYIDMNYDIEIDINKNIPVVIETGNKIDKKYPHFYSNTNELCLATDIEQEIYLMDHSFIEWIGEYVEKYFVTYYFYNKYNIYPFGESSHGNKGIVEFFGKYFKVEKYDKILDMLSFVCEKDYKGHILCPCGSNEKIKKCHGNIILKCKNSKEMNLIKQIYEELIDEK